MKKYINPQFYISQVVSAFMAYAYWAFFLQSEITKTIQFILILIYLFIIFTPIAYILLVRIILPGLMKYSSRIGLPLIALSCALIIIFAFPVNLPSLTSPIFSPPLTIEITATGLKNPASMGSEVWVNGVYLGSQKLSEQDFNYWGNWEIRDGVSLSYQDQPATLQWQGTYTGPVEISFVSHAWSGIVTVNVNGVKKNVDLFSSQSTAKTLNFGVNNAKPPVLYSTLTTITGIITLGILILALLVWIMGRPPKEVTPVKVGRWTWLLYALPMIAVWSFFLMVFWPGLMSLDSIDQWGQMLSGKINDVHPAFHTFYIWLVTRIYLSPASVAISQIIFMAMAVGLIMQEVTYWSVPLWLRIAITSIFTLMPANILMVITLWKDIPYTISVLLLWLIMLKMIRTKGEWINLPKNFIYLLIALIATAMFRHNGLFVSLLFIISLWFILPSLKKALIITTIIAVSYIAIKGPVYSLLKVERAPAWFSYQVMIHQLAAFLANDRIDPQPYIDLMNYIQPVNTWKSNYNCYSSIPVIYNIHFYPKYFDTNTEKYFGMWFDLAKENTRLLIDHQLCVTSILWKIKQPIDGYTDTYPKGIISNSYGLISTSVFPSVSTKLWSFFDSINKSKIYWLFWRPALYLYITLFSIIIASIRLNNRNILMLLVPSLANTLSMMVLIPTQDFRYQYPSYVIGILSFSMLYFRSLPLTFEDQ